MRKELISLGKEMLEQDKQTSLFCIIVGFVQLAVSVVLFIYSKEINQVIASGVMTGGGIIFNTIGWLGYRKYKRTKRQMFIESL